MHVAPGTSAPLKTRAVHCRDSVHHQILIIFNGPVAVPLSSYYLNTWQAGRCTFKLSPSYDSGSIGGLLVIKTEILNPLVLNWGLGNGETDHIF